MEKRNISRLFTREIAVQALKDSFIKLNPGRSGEKSGNFHRWYWSTNDNSGCIY